MPRVFYPSASVRVTALVQLSRTRDDLQTAVFMVTPRSVVITRNDYNHADKVQIEFDAVRFPIAPRSIRQIHFQVYAGDAESLDVELDPVAQDQYLRFIGWGDEPELALDDSDGSYKIEARDYTALFLDRKHPPPGLVPRYGEKLDVALRRITTAISDGDNIKLRLEGLDEWPEIPGPVGLSGHVMPSKDNADAWTLVKLACDPCALIPRVELDTLVVGTSRGLKVPARRAVFIMGENLISYSEKRNLSRLMEGIGLRGFDQVTGDALVAHYPPVGDATVAKKPKKKAAKKHGTPPVTGTDEKRMWFPVGSVASQEALEDMAERIFHDRNRQEFEGSFKCARFVVPEVDQFERETADEYDVTTIQNGDRIMIDVWPEHRMLLGGLESTEARVQFLVDQGYAPELASTLVEVFEAGMDGPLEVYVKTATHKYDPTDGYSLEVVFNNLVNSKT